MTERILSPTLIYLTLKSESGPTTKSPIQQPELSQLLIARICPVLLITEKDTRVEGPTGRTRFIRQLLHRIITLVCQVVTIKDLTCSRGGLLDQKGVIVNSYYKRYSVRSNITRKVTDWFEVGNNLSITKSINRMARTNSESYAVIPSAIAFNPTRLVFDPTKDSGFTKTLQPVWLTLTFIQEPQKTRLDR